MNVVKDIWTKSFIHNTYSCIEGRGIHLCANNLKRDLRKYYNETKYCLKLDIRKFYITKYDWRIYTKNRKENIKPQT